MVSRIDDYQEIHHSLFVLVSDVSLTIVKQPEQQHRARYQTEGSRGAVKDREGNGFPIVQLIGYYKPTTLQVGLTIKQEIQNSRPSKTRTVPHRLGPRPPSLLIVLNTLILFEIPPKKVDL